MELGVGTLAYGVAVGALAATAVVFFLIAALRAHDRPLFVTFGVFTLTVTIAATLTVWMQKSPDTEEYADRLKHFGTANLISLVAMIALVQVWTGGINRWVLLLLSVVSAGMAALHLLLPVGLLAEDVTAIRTVVLFDESFVVHEANASPWRPALDAWLLLTLAVLAFALWRHFRRGGRSEAAVLLAGISITAMVSMYDSLVDQGITNTPYLAPFGALASVGVAAWYLAHRLARAEQDLQMQAAGLEATVIERTAALKQSALRLEQQLARQRQSVVDLTSLASQFEATNALTVRNDDTAVMEASLQTLLGGVATLVGAQAASLRLIDPPDPVPVETTWRGADAVADGATPWVVPITIGARRLGTLTLVKEAREPMSSEEQRYAALTCDHLAGFIDRVDLSHKIAEVAIDSERERIAQELHDSVTQKLYSIAFLADAVASDGTVQPSTEIVYRMRVLLLASLSELRSLLFELRPEALDDARLPHLIEQLVETYQHLDSIEVTGHVDSIDPLPAAIRVGFYRIAQEAVSNASRHSGSDRISVGLEECEGVVTLRIDDAGRGFDPVSSHGGYGLANMRQRAASLGAELQIDGGCEGTSVVLTWVRPSARGDVVAGRDHAGAQDL